ncbi:MAG: type-F conjugative transfer system pilin assembly protein TrbC [Betaproteobacteria bacterium]|nr:type-F conjugative transfer system pilin assembly protein TrbC [Betaproteobacteria bacterium]
MIALLACAVLACMVLRAHAQTPAGNAGVPATVSVRPPTDAEIERAAREHRMPTDAELERIAIPSTPKLDGTGPTAPLDLEQLARQLQDAQAKFARAANDTAPRLQIFVTLAMPEPSLRALIAQAARANAVLVLRGAKNGSLRQTLEAARTLIGTQPVAWQIDPPAFARYQISAAPAFVLTRAGAQPTACTEGVCLADHDFAKVTGDVSLDYALEAIARGAPHFAADAEALLTPLRRRP